MCKNTAVDISPLQWSNGRAGGIAVAVRPFMMRLIAAALSVLAALLVSNAAVAADPVNVKYTEGVTRGFPVLRSLKGEKLAQGDLIQVARGDRVESRMVFRFLDGSHYEEAVVYSQRDVFTLLRYELVQRGPSFPETIEAVVDRETERYEVRYRADEDSEKEVVQGRLTLPPDAYNGMLTTVLKNLQPGASQVVQIIAFMPKPRLVKVLLTPVAQEPVLVGDAPLSATRFAIKPQLGMFASLLIADVPDVKCWIMGGEAPGFLKCEGPLYFMGPIWRIELN